MGRRPCTIFRTYELVYENQLQVIRLKSDLSGNQVFTKQREDDAQTTVTQITQLEEIITLEKIQKLLEDAAMWSPHVTIELQMDD